MHELSVAIGLIDAAAEEAARRDGAHVVAIHLKLGQLSGVVKEALISAYDMARCGTLLEHARLVIEDVAVTVHCPACDAQRAAVSVYELACSVCGTPASSITRGRELEIVALEIES